MRSLYNSYFNLLYLGMDQKERIGRKTNKDCFIHEYDLMVIDFSVELYGTVWLNFFFLRMHLCNPKSSLAL